MKIDPIIFLLYFLLGSISKFYCTNTPPDDASRYETVFKHDIRINLDQNHIESVYVSHKISNLTEDPICSLSKAKKMALCELIFQELRVLENDKKLPIYVNKTAFLVNSVFCEQKTIDPLKTIFFIPEFRIQNMYPCYGRHDPIRTDYRTDNYYSKIFISTGSVENTVFAYICRNNSKSDRCNILSYRENVRLTHQLPNSIDILQVLYELKLGEKSISITENLEEVENIYLTEYYHFEQEEEICNWPIEKKASICEFILKEYINKLMPNIVLNKNGFLLFNTLCETNSVKIRYYKYFVNKLLWQKMLPCYYQSKDVSDVSLFSEYFKYFYITKGSRENSVFIYIKNETSVDSIKYNLFALLENINFVKLDPVIKKQSSEIRLPNATSVFIKTITNMLQQRKKYIFTTFLFLKNNLKRILQVRKQIELNLRAKNDENLSYLIENINTSVYIRVLSITKNQVTFENEILENKIQKYSTLNEKKISNNCDNVKKRLLKLIKNSSSKNLEPESETEFIEKKFEELLLYEKNMNES